MQSGGGLERGSDDGRGAPEVAAPLPPDSDGAEGDATIAPPGAPTVLRRAMARRCPRCGRGRLFRSWFRLEPRCASCHLCFEGPPGSDWALWVLLDRVFVIVALVPFYLGLTTADLWIRLGLFALLLAALVATMPHRQALIVAIEYWTETRRDERRAAGGH